MTKFRIGDHAFDLSIRSLIVGILNVTPDSFSDGGKFYTLDKAIAHAEQMLTDGADIIDIGGESTRPGAKRVSVEEELERVIPVVRELRHRFPTALLSIDTVKLEVAQAAAAEGINIVNDTSGLRHSPQLATLAAQTGLSLVIMHSSADPEVMQQHTDYDDVVADVQNFLATQAQFAISQGVEPERIAIDPGIGFGKTVEQNFKLIKGVSSLAELGFAVLLGVSRKSFIGKTLDLPVDERLEGTLAMQAAGYIYGARIFRVHDVKEAVRVARMMEALAQA